MMLNLREKDEDCCLSNPVILEDRIYKFKNRYLVHAVHRRPGATKLVFVFSGVDATPATCRMSYFGLGESLNANVVHIMDNFGAHGCYLLSIAGDNQVRNAMVSLVRELQHEFSCNQDNTYFLGTLKGATTAIAYSLMTGGGQVICGEPQVMLGDFIYSSKWEELEQWRSLAYSILGRVNIADKQLLNSLLLEIVSRYGPRYTGFLHIHVGQTGYLENHLTFLCSKLAELGKTSCVSVYQHGFEKHGDVVPVFLQQVDEALGSSDNQYLT